MNIRDVVVYEVIFVLFFGLIGVFLVSNFLSSRNVISLYLGLFMCLIMYIGIFVMVLKLRNIEKDLERLNNGKP